MRTGALFALAGMLAGVGSSTAACAQRAEPQPAPTGASCRINPASVTPMIRPRHEERKASRVAQVDAGLSRTRADVLALGDSITERWPQASLEQAFPGEQVLNMGVGGDHVADLLFRLDGRTAQVAGQQALGVTHWRAQSPRLVTIMIGTNDLRGAAPCFIASGIVAATQRVHALYPRAKVVVLSILPRGDTLEQFADDVRQVNALVAAEARKSGRFEFVDLTSAFACAKGSNCGLTIPKTYIHPSDKGYAQLVAALRARLTRR